MSISAEIQALISRMDDHPEEFISESWHPVRNSSPSIHRTRWESISEVILQIIHAAPVIQIFTPEEIDAYKNKFTAIVRARTNEGIIKELVGQEQLNALDEAKVFRDKQLSLPLGTSNVNANITRTGLQIIGEAYK